MGTCWIMTSAQFRILSFWTEMNVQSLVLLSLILMSKGTSNSGPVHYNQAAIKLGRHVQEWSDNILKTSEIQAKVDKEVLLSDTFNGAEKLQQIAGRLSNFFKTTFEVVDNLKAKIMELYKTKSFQHHGSECCKIQNTHFDEILNDEVSHSPCYTRSAAAPNVTMVNITGLFGPTNQNSESSPHLAWQYYSSEEGIAIFYPGVKSADCFNYDPRYRPYYVETATTPKDLVILLDRSSYMGINNKFDLAKTAAATIVNTLNPNDRISLVVFSSQVKTPSIVVYETCFDDEMAHATPQVKQHLKSYLDELEVIDSSNYSNAFIKAFDLLESVQDTEDRDKGILLLTGHTSVKSNPKNETLQLLASLKQKNSQVLLLIYDFEEQQDVETNLGKELLKEMADTGTRKGHFEEIQDSDHLRAELVHYYTKFTAKSMTAPTVTVPYTDFYNLGHIFSVCHHIKHDGMLRGVACTDRTLDDLRNNFDLVEDDSVYAFIIDHSGRTMVHPLLPHPGSDPSSDPLFVNIKVLEPEAASSGIISSMLQSIKHLDDVPKNKTISKRMVSSSGDTRAGDYRRRNITVSYHWNWVHNTKFAVCLVITNGRKNFMLKYQEKHPKHFHYHLSDLKSSCVHHGEQVTTEYTTVSLGADAFSMKGYINETRSYIRAMTNYMTGKGEFHDLKEDIRQTLALLEDHTDSWKESFQSSLLQLRMKTHNGIVVTFPGKSITPKIRHLDFVWYKKSHVTSDSVYLIRNKSLITLAQPITKKSKSQEKVWAVVAMDFAASLLKHFLETTVLECSQSPKYSCIIMDENANIIWHPDLEGMSDYSSAVSIHRAEPDIGQYLIEKRIILQNQCTDYSWKKTYHTWRVSGDALPRNTLTTYPFIFFTPVTGTNLYFIVKNNENATDYKTCSACRAPYRCDQFTQCHCPCLSEVDYQLCSGEFLEDSEDIVPPCVQQLQQYISTGLESPFSTQVQLPSCERNVDCHGIKEEWRCMMYSECSWCTGGQTSTHDLSHVCTSAHLCKPQTTTLADPAIAKDVSCEEPRYIVAILLSVIITMVVTVAVLLLVWKCFCVDAIKKFCFSKVVVQASGDPYFDIGKVKGTQEQKIASTYISRVDNQNPVVSDSQTQCDIKEQTYVDAIEVPDQVETAV